MIGCVLGGRYEILEAVDSGGMAYVYKALCHKTNKFVAIKVLKDKFSCSSEYINRFKKEAEAAFSLEHENIVHVSDIGCDGGVYYIVMEYVEGATLKALISRDGKIPERDAILYTIQICSALSAAHKKGIIHRDIKPHNVLVDKDNTAKVTDFGIAKSLSAAQEEEKEVIGSVYYVSPEQARGDNVDARSDIYSLGIMLYEMLTGELPYTGDQTVSVALKHINEQITAPIRKNPELSQSVSNIVLKATSKNKKDRYRSMDAFKEDLVRAIVDPSGSFVELPAGYRTVEKISQNFLPKHKRWKICILAGLLAGVLAAVILGITLFQNVTAQKIKLPDFTGRGVDTATEKLNELGFKVSIAYDNSEVVKEGEVIAQTPEANSVLSSGDTITLTISDGPPRMLMPNMKELTLAEAQLMVEQMGLSVDNVTYELHDDMPPEIVISQLPEVDTELQPGTSVSLVVSTDVVKEEALMPMVTELPIDQAMAKINESGFDNCFVYERPSEFPEGIVYDQGPVAGKICSLSEEVDLWVSEYAQKDYIGMFAGQVDIADKDSKVKIVLETVRDGVKIYLVVNETQAKEVGKLSLVQEIPNQTGGTKVVKVYINNVETLTKDVVFVERNNES